MEIATILERIDPTKKFTTGTSSMDSNCFGIRRFSNSETTVIRVFLRNGLILSIVSGGTSYSSIENDTFEVAIFEDGKLNYTLTDGDVLSHQSLDDIRDLIIKIGGAKNET